MDKFKCKFCGKECKNANSLSQHQLRCKNNPDRLASSIPTRKAIEAAHEANKGKKPWNKGLTAETSAIIKNANIKISKALTGKSTGKCKDPAAEKQRCEKIKETCKLNKKSGGLREGSGRGKKGWYKGFFCDSTYELVYIIYNIDHNVKFSRNTTYYEYTLNGKKHKYFPDFRLSDNSLVEIKGYHTDLVDLKAKCVNDTTLTILYEDDLRYAFNYVKDNYTYNHLSDLYEKTES